MDLSFQHWTIQEGPEDDIQIAMPLCGLTNSLTNSTSISWMLVWVKYCSEFRHSSNKQSREGHCFQNAFYLVIYLKLKVNLHIKILIQYVIYCCVDVSIYSKLIQFNLVLFINWIYETFTFKENLPYSSKLLPSAKQVAL